MIDGRHGDNTEGNGQGDYDHSSTKPVEDAGGGKHDQDDR
ncbi:hypothetical protein GCM10012275_51080 [Longimycelium tulufanense]|uniref:Uncharacterized protein n=1 Tax=Longimycelium tulufanense TaxID=907463 RepID=A0A8J3FXH0_9PSEU|nr:hypothetical protein GCM10012275_51080 [Longimycelium tulufanense]